MRIAPQPHGAKAQGRYAVPVWVGAIKSDQVWEFRGLRPRCRPEASAPARRPPQH